MEYLHSTAPGLRTDEQKTEETLPIRASPGFPSARGCEPNSKAQGTGHGVCGETGAQSGARLCWYDHLSPSRVATYRRQTLLIHVVS